MLSTDPRVHTVSDDVICLQAHFYYRLKGDNKVSLGLALQISESSSGEWSWFRSDHVPSVQLLVMWLFWMVGEGISSVTIKWIHMAVCVKASTGRRGDCGLFTIHQPPTGLLHARRFCNMSFCLNDHAENTNPQWYHVTVCGLCLFAHLSVCVCVCVAPTIRSNRCSAASEDDYHPAW